jgi:ubiquinone/menaquinone biosynthesis C-methylase UbiE
MLGQVMSRIDHNAESVSTFNKYAARYAEKYFDLTQYDIYYEMLASRLPQTGAKFIDIASGPGNVAAYVRKARQDAVIYCVDDSQNMLEEALARVSRIQPVKLDCRNLHKIDEKFDGAAFFFGLNYLNDDDCILLFKGLSHILKPNGFLLIATITGESSDTGYQANNSGDRVYMVYRTPSVVRALLESSGFNCLIFDKVGSPDNSTQKTDDIVALTTYVGLTPHSSGTPNGTP